jgi:hypothetical protein
VATSPLKHKTVSMFYRYNITSAADKIDALRKLADHLAAQPKGERQRGSWPRFRIGKLRNETKDGQSHQNR